MNDKEIIRLSVYDNNVSNDIPTVTVGLCAKNSETVMKDAVESIMKQNISKSLMEFIFVNDGSEDNTLKIITNYASKMDFPVRIYSHEWKGLGPSRNVIVKESRGKYIVWVDADQIIPDDMVSKLVNFMENNTNVGIAKGIIGVIPNSSLVATLEMIYHQTAQLRDIDPVERPLGTGSSIYRKQALLEVDGFDESFKGGGEDVDIEYRIKEKGWLHARVPSATFYEKCRETWKELWKEYSWHGKGSKKAHKKNVPIHQDHPIILLPFILLLTEINRSFYAYNKTKKKISFLLPIHWLFKRAAWSYGFIMSN